MTVTNSKVYSLCIPTLPKRSSKSAHFPLNPDHWSASHRKSQICKHWMFLQNGFLYKRCHKHRNFISKVRVHILMATCKTWGSVDVTAHLWNTESKTTKYWQVLPNLPVFFACCVCFNICQRSEFYTKTHRGSVFAVPKHFASLACGVILGDLLPSVDPRTRSGRRENLQGSPSWWEFAADDHQNPSETKCFFFQVPQKPQTIFEGISRNCCLCGVSF